MTVRSLVLEIKENSLDDGPGIRSVVFFKGCPLSCAWCHNPESRAVAAEISYDAAECIESCDLCIRACPPGALARAGATFIDRDKCDMCFACLPLCPAGALERVGVEMAVEEIVARVEKDRMFFANSGGGVTLSGGEPTRQIEFAAELARALAKERIPVLLETCGHFQFERFETLLYPWLDAIYFDLKLYDSEAHQRWCGVSNRVILENFARLYERSQRGGVTLLPRVPLVPEITATDANLRGLASFLVRLGVTRARLLPYNPMWVEKLPKTGAAGAAHDHAALRRWMTHEEIRHCEAVFRDAGIAVSLMTRDDTRLRTDPRSARDGSGPMCP